MPTSAARWCSRTARTTAVGASTWTTSGAGRILVVIEHASPSTVKPAASSLWMRGRRLRAWARHHNGKAAAVVRMLLWIVKRWWWLVSG